MPAAAFSNDELALIRAQFPALVAADDSASPTAGYVFAENAGGSQVLSTVASAIASYLLRTNVQMAAYPLAAQAESRVSHGTCAAAALLGASSADDVMVGQSATQLVFTLSLMLEQRVLSDRTSGAGWQLGDEIIISDADHETNRGAWTRLAERLGLTVKHWPVTPTDPSDPYAVILDPKVLATLVTARTRLVAFTACSNLLGHFTDIAAAVEVVRAKARDAVVCVDCVAFAPHRRMVPQQWGVDVSFFSLYKTYGAHVGAMYVDPRIKAQLERLNHFFLRKPEAKGMYPYQTSSVQYELNHSIAPVADYFVSLARPTSSPLCIDWNSLHSRPSSGLTPSGTTAEAGLTKWSQAQLDEALDLAFAKIAAHESEILAPVVRFLLAWKQRGVRIVGPEQAHSTIRAPTVAFILVDPNTGAHRVGSSKHIHHALVHAGKVGAQQGHMYAHKLVQSLNLDLADGVVRLSFVHYNTLADVDTTLDLLQSVLEQHI